MEAQRSLSCVRRCRRLWSWNSEVTQALGMTRRFQQLHIRFNKESQEQKVTSGCTSRLAINTTAIDKNNLAASREKTRVFKLGLDGL